MNQLSIRTTRKSRRGALLLEVLLSIALFSGTAAFTLGAANSVFDALDRAKREQEAIDIARSKMAELQTGMINIRDLRSDWSGDIGSYKADADFDSLESSLRWTIEVQTSPTEFIGLSLVELTVSELEEQFPDQGRRAVISFTLRQLLPLSQEDIEEYQVDEILEGLPEEPSP
ncbi:MAG: hypothetical protein IH984_02095 [Planctomycetes bacterium]|nr:hypothetical protein [Planctomycetota bacterium]